jgi:transposase
MEDAEWAFFEPFLMAVQGQGGRPASDHRRVLNGIFWIARTGAAWRDLPEEFGKWSSVYRQFRRWTLAGLWELVLDALNDSGAAPDGVQMIDSTVIRAHHLAAGAKGGLKDRVLAVQKVASRPKSTSLPTLTASLSGRK